MTAKQRIYRLVDELPDSELPAAERYLEYLRDRGEYLVFRALDQAPADDEPDDDDFDGGLTEARAEMRDGKGIPHEEVKRRLGLS